MPPIPTPLSFVEEEENNTTITSALETTLMFSGGDKGNIKHPYSAEYHNVMMSVSEERSSPDSKIDIRKLSKKHHLTADKGRLINDR